MKTTRFILYAAIAAVLSVSGGCGEDKDFYDDGNRVYTKERVDFGLSYNSWTFSEYGETLSLYVNSSSGWKATGMADWVELSATSGESSQDVLVTVEANPTMDSRINAIDFAMSTYDFVHQTFTASQNGGSPYIKFVDNSNMTVPAAAATYEIPFVTNVPEENITTSFTYNSPEMTATVGNGVVTLHTTDRTSTSGDYNYLTITATYNYSTYTDQIRIYQEGISGSSDVSQESITAAEQDFSYSFTTNANWRVGTTTSSWLSAQPSAGAAGSNTISIHAESNSSSSARVGYVYIVDNESGTRLLTLTVNQAGISASGTTDALTHVSAQGGTYAVNFTCDGNWVARPGIPAISVAPSSGTSGTTNVQITVAPNYSASQRTSKVYFRTESGTTLWTVDVQQDVAQFTASKSELSFSGKGGSETVEFHSDLPWEIKSNTSLSWLTISPSSGSAGDYTITFTAEPNTNLSSREATFYLGYSFSLSKGFVISQKGAGLTGDDNITAGWESTGIGFDITAPGAWTAAVSDASWMSLSTYSGDGPEQIAVILTENTSDQTRKGSILIAAGGRTTTVDITQLGQYIHVEGPETTFPAMGGHILFETASTVGIEAYLQFPEGADGSWLDYTVYSRSQVENFNITLTAQTNNTRSARTAQLVVIHGPAYDGSKAPQNVIVDLVQPGRSISANTAALFINGTGGNSESVLIEADGDYTVQRADSDTWFTVVTTEAGFYIVATPNTTGAERRGTVLCTLKDIEGDNAPLEIPVIQSNQSLGFEIEDYAPDKIWQ
ncbi:MAG: hypothetical protein K2L28_09905 [Muribaculaceae bacterium]|nr:hypothetical protein [Muribaculaceae bacterium]